MGLGAFLFSAAPASAADLFGDEPAACGELVAWNSASSTRLVAPLLTSLHERGIDLPLIRIPGGVLGRTSKSPASVRTDQEALLQTPYGDTYDTYIAYLAQTLSEIVGAPELLPHFFMAFAYPPDTRPDAELLREILPTPARAAQLLCERDEAAAELVSEGLNQQLYQLKGREQSADLLDQRIESLGATPRYATKKGYRFGTSYWEKEIEVLIPPNYRGEAARREKRDVLFSVKEIKSHYEGVPYLIVNLSGLDYWEMLKVRPHLLAEVIMGNDVVAGAIEIPKDKAKQLEALLPRFQETLHATPVP